jgi:hypothetical protein
MSDSNPIPKKNYLRNPKKNQDPISREKPIDPNPEEPIQTKKNPESLISRNFFENPKSKIIQFLLKSPI